METTFITKFDGVKKRMQPLVSSAVFHTRVFPHFSTVHSLISCLSSLISSPLRPLCLRQEIQHSVHPTFAVVGLLLFVGIVKIFVLFLKFSVISGINFVSGGQSGLEAEVGHLGGFRLIRSRSPVIGCVFKCRSFVVGGMVVSQNDQRTISSRLQTR